MIATEALLWDRGLGEGWEELCGTPKAKSWWLMITDLAVFSQNPLRCSIVMRIRASRVQVDGNGWQLYCIR